MWPLRCRGKQKSCHTTGTAGLTNYRIGLIGLPDAIGPHATRELTLTLLPLRTHDP